MHPLKARIKNLVEQQNQSVVALEKALSDARELADSSEMFRREFGHDSWESYRSTEVSPMLRFPDSCIKSNFSDFGNQRFPRVMMNDLLTGLPFYADVNEDGY
jgi:hypothetical protein